MRRVLAILAILGLAAAAPGRPSPHVTYFGESLLARCDLVVRAKVVSRVQLANGMTLTTFEVEETLLGESPGERLVLGSPDPGYHGEPGRESVLFLERDERPRSGFRTLERFASDDDEGPARLAMARAYVRVESIADPVRRVTETRALHVGNIAGEDEWARANAIRELSWFTRHWADTFSKGERDRLFGARERVRDRELREMLDASLHRIDAARSGRRDGPPRTPRRDREADYREALDRIRRTDEASLRASRLQALAAARRSRIRSDLEVFLDDPAPAVRSAAAYWIGECEQTPAADRLLAVLGREKEDPSVRRNAIRALGILGHEAAVPALGRILERPESALAEPAVLALARIGSDAAKETLDARRGRLGEEGERARAVRRILEFVASPDFVRQEEILARLRRSRLSADR
jgi:hypothetical protein